MDGSMAFRLSFGGSQNEMLSMGLDGARFCALGAEQPNMDNTAHLDSITLHGMYENLEILL